MSSQFKFRRGSTLSHTIFTGSQGEVTFNTDTNALVTHDGVTPGGFAGGGYLPPGIGAVPMDVQKALNLGAIPVEYFGGDVNSPDNAAAIQRGIDHLLTLPRGGTLTFNGLYTSGPFAVNNAGVSGQASVTFDGSGGAKIILKNGSNASLLTIHESANQVYLNGISLDGNKANQSGVSHGINCPQGVITYAGSVRLQNVRIVNFLTDNIHIEFYRSFGYFDHVFSEGAGRYSAFFDSVDHEITNSQFGNSGSHAVYLGRTNIDFVNCDIYGAGASGIACSSGAQIVNLTNCLINGNANHGILIPASDFTVSPPIFNLTNCTFSTNGRAIINTYDNINIVNADGLTLLGCRFGYSFDSDTYKSYVRYHIYASGQTRPIFAIGCYIDGTARATGAFSDPTLIQEITNNRAATSRLSEADKGYRSYAAAVDDNLLRGDVVGEANPRCYITHRGVMEIGGGASAPDVQIKRSAANVLSMGDGDSFRLSNTGCMVMQNPGGGDSFLWVDTTNRLRISSTAPANRDAEGTVVGAQT